MTLKHSYIKTPLPNLKLLFLKMNAAKPGPAIFLTGCIHGDEPGGKIIIKELYKQLQKKKLLKGTLYALPIANPLALKTKSREIGKNKEDLNRAFPGNPKGSQADKLAHTIFTEIKHNKPDLVIDIHNDWVNTLPYVEIDFNPGNKNIIAYNQVRKFSDKLGLPAVRELKQEALAHKLHKSLSASLLRQNIPALTLEIGGSHVFFSRQNLTDAVQAIWKLLTYLNMVVPQKPKFSRKIPTKFLVKILSYSHQPTATHRGTVKFLVKPGIVVKKDQPIAQILNKGKVQETLISRHRAIILGHTDSDLAKPGDALVSFGIL